MTRSQLEGELATRTQLAKVQIKSVFDALVEVAGEELGRGHALVVPNLVKILVVQKPARPAKSMRNPFTGEQMMTKPKPAHKAIKVKAVKALKDMA